MIQFRSCNTQCDQKTLSTIQFNDQQAEDSHEYDEKVLEIELQSIKEMISLLINYQKSCIQKVDLQSAKQTRNRIQQLSQRQNKLIKIFIQLKQDKEAMNITQKYEQVLEHFDVCWNEFLNKMVVQLAKAEDRLRLEHLKKKEEIIQKLETQKRNFKPSVQLNNIKRKALGLIKLRQYQEAEFEANNANKLQTIETKVWQQKIQEKKNQALSLLSKKQNKQFQVLRSKNEDIIFKKLNERDSKFDILLKKNMIKQGEIKKTSKQMAKTLSTASLSTNRNA